jgi:hypothetical protein
MGLNGQAAINWMRAKRTNVPGSCLNTVWQAYGSHSSIGAHAGQYPDAIDGWLYATKRHPNDLNPPAGFPVWYGPSPTRTDDNAGAGDVVISIGNGQIIGTDVGGAGRIGVMSLISRGQIIQRPYLGWTEDFLGYDIDGNATIITAAPVTPIIIPTIGKGRTVNFWQDTNGTIFYGSYPIPNMQTYALLVRYEKSTIEKPDDFNPAERDMILAALHANGLHN